MLQIELHPSARRQRYCSQALIRIFLFSLGEKGQPISASITLPGARTWNCRVHGPSDGTAGRRWSGGLWFCICVGAPCPFPPLVSWRDAKNDEEGAQKEMSLKRTHACVHMRARVHNAHTRTHWGVRNKGSPHRHVDWSSVQWCQKNTRRETSGTIHCKR